MAHPALDQALISARSGLTLYVLGPGVGECQVVLLPDGKVIVVDACMTGDRNLGVELLRALGVAKVDLFVVTHPDKDHVRGASGLLDAFPPQRVWIFPAQASLRWVLVKAKRLAQQEGMVTTAALRDLTELMERIEALPPTQVEEVRGRRAPWTFVGCGYEVHAIAPAMSDEIAEARILQEKMLREERPAIKARAFVQWVEDFLDGSQRPNDHPNALSIALSIVHGERRVLLAGDVERCEADPSRGWSGVMRELADPSANKTDLIRSLSAIKVAHHGSEGAVSPDAWREHCASFATPVGVIAPYASTPLPRADGLAAIRARCTKIAITRTTPKTRADAVAAGWREITPASTQIEDFPMVSVEIPEVGSVEVSVWGEASVWQG